MRRRIIFFLSLLVTAAVLVVLFCFSAQPVSESDGISRALAKLLAERMPGLMERFTIGRLNHLLRKCAHFTLYFFLGCGLTGVLCARGKALPALMAIPIGLLCAALDEWHQAFVPGRGPGLRDVALDTCGVITAVALISLVLFLVGKRRRSKE